MPVESIINSFSAGELSPSVYGRTDLQQYQQGAADLTNMIVLPNGSARKRPGTKYLLTVSDITDFGRLCKFQVGETEEYVGIVTSTKLKIYDVDDPGTPKANIAFALADTAEKAKRLKKVQAKYDCVFVSREFGPYVLQYNTSTGVFTSVGLTIGSPATSPTFSATTENRPGAVTLVDERVIFGGTNTFPNGLWGSAIKALDNYTNEFYWTETLRTITYNGDTAFKVFPGEYYPTDAQPGAPDANDETSLNFYANPAGATDAAPWNFQILDNTYIDILWITSTNTLQNGFLVVGARSGLYAIVGGAIGGSISAAAPLNSVRLQSSAGASDVQGIIVNNYLLYVDSSKRRIRVAMFNLQTDQYDTARLTDLSDHLFDSDIKEIHYQRSPQSILWVVLENGKVLTFSYDSTGALSAWSPMDFGENTTVLSMEVLDSADEDIPVFLMYNSEQEDYTIERLQPFEETNQDEFWYVDSGVRQYNATPFTTVSGLTHLEGETLKAWVDGSAHPDVTVSSGAVTLNRSANTAIVGRGYNGVITTLPIQTEQDKVKRASRVFIRFLDTIGAKAGTEEFEEIVPFMEGNFTMGAKPAQFSGLKEIPYSGRYENDANITVFSDSPTPFHVLSITTRLEIYG